MSTDHPYPEQSPPQPPPSSDPVPERPDPEAGQSREAGMAPEAIQAADTDRHAAEEALEVERPTRGVDWVRPSDLLTRAGGQVARRGIDFQDALSRHIRTGIAASATRAAGAARRLPPLAAFGRDEPVPDARGLGR